MIAKTRVLCFMTRFKSLKKMTNNYIKMKKESSSSSENSNGQYSPFIPDAYLTKPSNSGKTRDLTMEMYLKNYLDEKL